MSTPEQASFAAPCESCVTNFSLASVQLLASFGELKRLNLETCRLVYAGAGLHWENVLRAQTPEQLLRHQADALPWLALQISGYTQGWMDIASETAASLNRSACDVHHGQTRHVSTMLNGVTKCARGVDTMMDAMNPARADSTAAPDNVAPTAAKRRRTSQEPLSLSR